MIERIAERLRAEYLEMPGLQLRPEQVQRFCGIEQAICQVVLDALVASKFLCLRTDGRYARLTEGYISSPRPAKADLVGNSARKKTA
jgi:hypothetical protein